MKSEAFLDLIVAVDRLHFQFSDVLHAAFGRTPPCNRTEALLLLLMPEDGPALHQIDLGRGRNVSQIATGLRKHGYLVLEPAEHDGRVRRVRLTDAGRALRCRMLAVLERHVEAMEPELREGLPAAVRALRRLDRFLDYAASERLTNTTT